MKNTAAICGGVFIRSIRYYEMYCNVLVGGDVLDAPFKRQSIFYGKIIKYYPQYVSLIK